MGQKSMGRPTIKKFLSLVKSQIFIIFVILISLDLCIFILPYLVYGYSIPVGWDKPWYIRNMRLIEEQGFFSLFRETQHINFFSLLEYSIAKLFNLSFIITSAIVPIGLALIFLFVNFRISKNIGLSTNLSIFSVALTLIDYNIWRMVGASLDRGLFSFILVEIAIFLILPNFLLTVSKSRLTLIIFLQFIAGISQLETFLVGLVVLVVFLMFDVKRNFFQRAKLILICISVPLFLVLIFESPFFTNYLEGHVVTNTNVFPWRTNEIADPITYLLSLGSGLIVFYLIGLSESLKNYFKFKTDLHLLLFLWNIIVISGSFIPLLGPRIPSWRFLLLVTLPPLASLGFTKLFLKKNFIVKRFLIIIVLIAIACTAIAPARFYKPWILDNELEKMQWIADNKQNDSIIIVYCVDWGEQVTYELADLHRRWFWSIIGTRANVYFGKVDYLLDSKPTIFQEWYMNYTSFEFWEDINNYSLKNTSIYLIAEWYDLPLEGEQFIQLENDIYMLKFDENEIYQTEEEDARLRIL